MNPFAGTFDRRTGTITMRQENGSDIYLFAIKKEVQICIAPHAGISAKTIYQHLIFVKRCDHLGLRTILKQRQIACRMQMAETDYGNVER